MNRTNKQANKRPYNQSNKRYIKLPNNTHDPSIKQRVMQTIDRTTIQPNEEPIKQATEQGT